MALNTKDMATLEAVKKAGNTDRAIQRLQESLKSGKITQQGFNDSISYLKPTPVVNKPVSTPVVNKPVSTPVVNKPVSTPVVNKPTPAPVVNKPKQAFVGADIAKKIGLTEADTQEYKTSGNYSKPAQALIDSYKAKRVTTSPAVETKPITSIVQVGGDIKKLKDLITSRYGGEVELKGDKVIGTDNGEKFVWNINSKGEVEKKPFYEDKAEQEATTSDLDKGILDKSKKEVAQTQIDKLEGMKKEEMGDVEKNLEASSDLLKTNNKALLNLFGIKEDGSIDTENTTSISYQMEDARKKFETLKNDMFKQFTGGRYAKVAGTIRQSLASRGVDASTIPPEQLIALSDSVGRKAFEDVYNAKQDLVNEIETNNKNVVNQINDLRQKGLVSANEAKLKIEELRQTTENQKNTIEKEYANAVFGITDKYGTEVENNKTATINAVTAFGEKLGLTGTGLSAIQSYSDKYNTPAEALKAMITDLNNPKSTLRTKVLSVEEATKALAQYKLETDRLKAQKSASSGSSTSFNATQQVFLRGISGYDIKTVDDLQTVLPNLPKDKQDQISSYLQYNVVSDTPPNNTEDQKKKSE